MTAPDQRVAVEPIGAVGLGDLRRIIAALDDERSSLAAAGDVSSLALGLAQIRTLMADLKLFAQLVEADVVGLMPSKTLDVDGLGRIERRKGTDRKAWDWETLLPRLVRLSVDPEGTGDMGTPADVCEALTGMVRDCIGVTPSKSPKLTALRGLGLDPDEWCETKPGRVTVQIHGEAAE